MFANKKVFKNYMTMTKLVLPACLLFLFCPILTSCSFLAKRVVYTPNYQKTYIKPNTKLIKKAHSFSVSSTHAIESNIKNAKISFYSLTPKNNTPIATCFLLHGYLRNSNGMLKFAEPLVAAGFQTILVDSRGSGSSEGDTFTFGINESKDLIQILDYLEKNKIAKPPFFVMGVSYGATTAILFGNQDKRIESIIAIAPFSSFEVALKHYMKLGFPLFCWMHSDKYIQKFANELGERGGFKPNDLEIILKAKDLKTKTLLLHGNNDWLIPKSHSEKLLESNSENIKAKYFDGYGHNSIYKDKKREIRRFVTQTLIEEVDQTLQDTERK